MIAECAHSSDPIIQLERYTSEAFSTYYNGAQKHVRNEQTFPEYLLPRALEKIWETPSLENERRAGGIREGGGGKERIVGESGW